MDATNVAIDEFDRHRSRLASIALGMLGSNTAADDAVQETWLRVSRSSTVGIDNVAGWLTTVTARVCLNMLRSRRARREDLFDIVTADPASSPGIDPVDEAILAESVSAALLIVLDTLDPAERVAFVLHDLFAVPFDEIALIVERRPAATRQLASRARRRVRGRDGDPTSPPGGDHRRVVDAFFIAARSGDLDGLLLLLDPEIELRSDGGATRQHATVTVRGARQIAGRALSFADPATALQPVLVSGKAGVLVTLDGERISLMAFTIDHGRIIRIDALVDPIRLRPLTVTGGPPTAAPESS